ncbi:MAG: hypothetical protein K5906_00660 [Bacilli bacterium]|nr:hypothetical protein [Bacilli bacterium]
MPETEQNANLNPKKIRIPKIFKNRYFIFGISALLFIFGAALLILLDTTNTFRPKWADFLYNWLKSINLTFDVSMATWVMFFVLFGVFFLVFFILIFYKNGLQKKQDKIQRKYNRDITGKEKVVYNLLFFSISIIVLVGAVVGAFIFLNMNGYMAVIKRQLSDFGGQMGNFFLAFALLLAFILAVPLAFALLLLIFKFFITIISLIVGGVSNSVMRSEGYQKNMAASQAAAADIERSMREARERAGEAVRAAHEAMNNRGNAQSPQADIVFPALTTIDVKWAEKEEAERKAEEEKQKAIEEAQAKGLPLPEEPQEEKDPNARPPLDYEQFKLLAYEFQSYLCHEKYYFKINTLRCFIAGLAAARLILLQGLSGTGKSTLPRVFLEYIGGDAYFFPVQATWRDRSDITGYYSDFTGQFKETELLKHLYEASYIPETVNLMVLDEMNISRVEYYFADFLSIFEYPSEDWIVPLMQVKPGTKLPKYIENGMARIPVNTWFVGTVNIDDSTFTITDKVYDRAIAIDFNELNLPFESSYRFDPHPIKVQELVAMFEECKNKPENNLTPAERKKFLLLTQFISDTFDVQFGNRIMNQIDNFLPVFVGLGGSKNEALDFMLARKVLRKLDGKFESYIKDGLNKLTRYLNSEYGKHVFPESEASIERYRRKLN